MGVLTVHVEKCTNLANKDRFGKSDPYVTLTVKNVSEYVGVDRDVGQKKSKIINNNLNPVFNQKFEFIISSLDDHLLYMSVKDDDGLLAKDSFLGKTEVKLWEVEGLEDSGDTPIEMSRILEQGKIYFRLSWKW